MVAVMQVSERVPMVERAEEVALGRKSPTGARGAAELTPWVLAAAGGDTRAFARLVEATSGLVTSIALAILRDAEQSKDLAQEVFVAAWRDLNRLRDPARFLPWLRQMTRNQANATLRGRVRRRRWLLPMQEELQADRIRDERPSAADELVAAQEQVILRETLAQLPEETRESLTLFYMEQQSIAQTAALLQLSEDATKQRLSRARRMLREDILERFGDAIGASAPGAAFGAAVLAALPFSAPGTAAAMTAAGTKATGGSTASSTLAYLAWLLKLAIPVATLSAPFLAMSWYGARQFLRIARDERERRQMRWFWATQMVLLVAAMTGFEVRPHHFQHWGDLVVFAAFSASLLAIHLLWLPRIVRRRHELEMREDPARATAARRREKLGRILGWGLGMGGAWVALVIKHVYYMN
jgi:RNA polymerase sigma factor (sigma-70 family)